MVRLPAAQTSASHVLDQTGEWSEATAKRLEGLLANKEARSKDFQTAGQSLLAARDFLRDVISQNAGALDRIADASRQVQAYSTGLAGQSDALGTLRSSSEQNEKLLAE